MRRYSTRVSGAYQPVTQRATSKAVAATTHSANPLHSTKRATRPLQRKKGRLSASDPIASPPLLLARPLQRFAFPSFDIHNG